MYIRQGTSNQSGCLVVQQFMKDNSDVKVEAWAGVNPMTLTESAAIVAGVA